jgi:ATP-dependent Clp protease ATP-binding subunit ClpC
VVENALKKTFAPEFLNRIDDVVIFNSLQKENIDKITKLEIEILFKRIQSKNYNLTYSDDVVDLISRVGFDETFGARPIKRAIQEKIEDFISEKILMDEIQEGKSYNLVVENDNVVIEIKKRNRKK